MADDDDERLTLEALQKFAPERAVSYRLRVEEKHRRMENQEDRIRALETGQARMEQTLGQIQAEQHATRTEQNKTLQLIISKVEAVSTAQTLETGRKLGAESAAAQALAMAQRGEDKREGWLKFLLPYIALLMSLAAVGWLATHPATRIVDVSVQPIERP